MITSPEEALSKLSPAETLLLLNPTNCKLRELMKFTLMDLLLRRILELKHVPVTRKRGVNPLNAYYFIRGKNFGKETPPNHEMIYLIPFYNKPKAMLKFRILLRMGYSGARNANYFKEVLLLHHSSNLRNLVRIGFWQRTWGTAKLTDEGKKLKKEIVRQFNVLDRTLPKIVEENSEKAISIMQEIKGNILLLTSFKFKMATIIGRELAFIEEHEEEGSQE